MATIKYQCDTCSREIDLLENQTGLTIFSNCIITENCRGTLYKIGRNEYSIRESFREADPDREIKNYLQRKLLFDFKKSIPSRKWRVNHKLGVYPALDVFIEENAGQNIIRLDKDQYIRKDVDSNSLELTFSDSHTGIVQAMARSISDPEVQQLSEIDDRFLVSYNGTLSVAILSKLFDEINLGALEGDSLINTSDDLIVKLEVSLKEPNQEEINCVETFGGSLASPWSDYPALSFRKRRNYVVKTTGLIDLNVIAERYDRLTDIPELTEFKIKRIMVEAPSKSDDKSGKPSSPSKPALTKFEKEIRSKNVLILLANEPYERIDKIVDRVIDVGELNLEYGDPEPIGDGKKFVFVGGQLYANDSDVERVYPNIQKDDVHVNIPNVTLSPLPSQTPTPTPSISDSATPTPTPTPSISDSATPTPTPTPTPSAAIPSVYVVTFTNEAGGEPPIKSYTLDGSSITQIDSVELPEIADTWEMSSTSADITPDKSTIYFVPGKALSNTTELFKLELFPFGTLGTPVNIYNIKGSEAAATSLIINDDGSRLIVTMSNFGQSDNLTLFNVNTDTEIAQASPSISSGRSLDAAFNSDSTRLLVATLGGGLALFSIDNDTFSELDTYTAQSIGTSVDRIQGTDLFWCASLNDDSISVVEIVGDTIAVLDTQFVTNIGNKIRTLGDGRIATHSGIFSYDTGTQTIIRDTTTSESPANNVYAADDYYIRYSSGISSNHLVRVHNSDSILIDSFNPNTNSFTRSALITEILNDSITPSPTPTNTPTPSPTSSVTPTPTPSISDSATPTPTPTPSTSSTSSSTDWTPADITTDLWLDADDGTTITLDGSNNVSQWADKSGNTRHFDQATSSDRPAFEASSLNGKPGVFFDTGELLERSEWASGDDHDLFAVVTPAGSGDRRYLLCGGTDAGFGDNAPLLLFALRNNNEDVGVFDGASWRGSAAATTGGQALGWMLDSSGSSGKTYRASEELETISYSPNSLQQGLNLGARTGAANNWSLSRIHELVKLDRVATQDERDKLWGYLHHKWGIEGQLPSGHPYKSSPPTVSDPTPTPTPTNTPTPTPSISDSATPTPTPTPTPSVTPTNTPTPTPSISDSATPTPTPTPTPSTSSSTDWTPADITTALWLDAADGTTIILDGSSNVERWEDKSGNAINPDQERAGWRPSKSANAVDFNGSQWLDKSLASTLQDGGGLMVAVFTPTVDGSYLGAVTEEFLASNDAVRVMLAGDTRSGSPKRFASHGDKNWVDLPVKEEPNLPKLSLLHNDGSTATGRLFGSDVASVTPIVFSGSTAVSVGRQSRASFEFIGGIHEVVWMDATPTADNIEKLEGYLAHKWDGILGTTELVGRLPSGHPYKSSPP